MGYICDKCGNQLTVVDKVDDETRLTWVMIEPCSFCAEEHLTIISRLTSAINNIITSQGLDHGGVCRCAQCRAQQILGELEVVQ